VCSSDLYDPRSYLKKGELGLSQRMVQACNDLKSTGKTIYTKA
jgi:fructose-bisphosphate aldolase class II